MTERDIPQSWLPGKAREPDSNMTRVSRKQQSSETHTSGIPATGSTIESVKRSTQSDSEELPTQIERQEAGPLSKKSWKLPKWTTSWVLWTLLLALVPGAIAFMSTAMLLKLPSAPNCPSIFWPLASASVRLHCAQLAASKQTVKDLQQAIALVKELPKNHPLREEIDRLIEEWSEDILRLADQSFQAGRLDEAIATARQVPKEESASELVETQITKWQSIWSKAEGIYTEAEAQMREQHWHQAFMLGSKLLRVDNKYWASTKYDQLNRLIVSAREDGEKLAKADTIAKSKGVNNLLKAIKVTESIQQDSYVYPKAQEALAEFGRQMLELAQDKLDGRDADQAISIAQKIPPSTGQQKDVQDFVTLAEAQRNAWLGTTSSLEVAISQAQQIEATRPKYQKAQELIANWQLEVKDVAHLEKARELASLGSISDFTAAIAEAQLIPEGNPRAQEAKKEIDGWVAQIQTIEDRPYLDRADQVAMYEDVNSLQTAIGEASRITQGRALYSEARRKIGLWTAKIQRIEDQPYLDQARNLANSGDLASAIATARQIPSGRALSGEAQTAIDEWQGQIRATQNWNKAREVAVTGTPQALARAIRIANRIPDNSTLRGDANIAIDQWSQQLLDIARAQGESDIPRAIETARMIPRGTDAYSSAREQIRVWEEYLNPQPQEPPQQYYPEPSTIMNGQ
ncbi:chromosome segregation ATPase [Brasilonema sp. UFV-L1]|uniref:chromosome segregation ATPase n=1 Tax=Brasilonema sp. UFV-L1 TaxID=2234130 RepID=UPI00145F4BB5|nr:chromosome segregation ATPase [Brasilonema sp. UFV-L1]NMG11680.1 chromosome segregation ATPase [Brasilonema sp. UFV-L1]